MFPRFLDVPLFTSRPVPVPLYLLPIWNSLYSLFLYSCLLSLRSSIRSNTCFYFTSKQPDSPTSIVLVSQPPQVLHELWDLDLGNVKAIPYVKLHAASPLLPPPLEDISHYHHFPGPPSWAYTSSGALMSGTHINYDLQQFYVDTPIYYNSYYATFRCSLASGYL
ncbi:hypothetical protein F5877DRAFT_86693 [Lentinula edodes]|nr:hypothetical protein F5877DRAFT_86693 [Lentinula edodes]